jgi:predicted enzyme related to lactoylglutathione lyase
VHGIDEIVVDCADPATLVEFWARVFGVPAVVRSVDWAYVDVPNATRIAFQQVPEPKTGKNRVHLDVDVDDIELEADRLLAAGAILVGAIQNDEYGHFQVMRDPEGNEFCLVRGNS